MVWGVEFAACWLGNSLLSRHSLLQVYYDACGNRSVHMPVHPRQWTAELQAAPWQ